MKRGVNPEKLAERVARVIADAPPLSDEQRERIASILNRDRKRHFVVSQPIRIEVKP